jgi:hypothetical protein
MLKQVKKPKSARLEIRRPELRANTLKLLAKIQKEPALLKAFVRNPTKAIANGIMKQRLAPQKMSESNRLLFALIANDEMLRWLKTYDEGLGGKHMDKQAFTAAFAKKIGELGDKNILAALVGNAAVNNGIPGLSSVAYQCVIRETTGKDSCACTPVAKASLTLAGVVTPDTLRAVTDALIAHAKQLSAQGKLATLEQQIL